MTDGNKSPLPPQSPADALVDAVTTAWRPRGPNGQLRYHPVWHDLDAVGREQAYDATFALRTLEAALDPEGLSSTARAVLARIRR
jgi:hypothetical protein